MRWPGARARRPLWGAGRAWSLGARLLAVAVAFALSAWLAVTSISYLDGRRLLDEAHQQIRALQESYAELSSDSDLLTTALLGQIADLEQRAAEQAATIAELRRTRAALNRRLEAQTQQLASVSAERDRAQQLLGDLGEAMAEGEASLAAAARERAALRRQLRAIERELAEVSRQRDVGRRAAAGLRWQVALLEDEVARLQSQGMSAKLWLEDWVLGSVEALEDLFVATGVDVERLVAQAASAPGPGQGGPLQVAAPDEIAPGAPPAADDPVGGNIHRLAALQRIASTLPLAAPLDQFFVTSPYGKRRDPFTKAWAHHAGLDLGAPRNSRILATAPGRVVVAGPSGPYGNMVEIDHGLGIVTRYGHLEAIEVAVGDEVEFRQTLGLIGNTGRSTSRHLHYEIRIDDRAFDPAKFLNAGRLLVGIFDAPRLVEVAD